MAAIGSKGRMSIGVASRPGPNFLKPAFNELDLAYRCRRFVVSAGMHADGCPFGV